VSEDLAPTWVVGNVDLTDYPFSVDRNSAVDIGEPEMIVETLVSQLADGDLEREVRHGNRTYVIPFYIEGPTLADVADAEALLRAELRRDGLTLTHDPGDSWAVPSVYEVQTARMTPSRDDVHESHLIRKWTLTLTCTPWARSVNATTVAALAPPPVSPTTVSITTADTTAGFSAHTGGGVSVPVTDAGAYVTVTFSPGLADIITYELGAPVDMSATRYVVWEMSGQAPAGFVAFGPTVAASLFPVLAQAESGGRTTYVLDVADLGPINQLRVFPPAHDRDSVTMNVHDISRTDTLPHVSPRQVSRIIEVGGTERAPASLHAQTSSGVLGVTLLHTTPHDGSGYAPGMRRWRSSGNTTSANVDARKITGTWELLRPNPVVSRTPAHSMPRGDYILLAAIKSDTLGRLPISWAVKSVISGITLGATEGTTYWNFTVANELAFVPITSLAAPIVRSGALDVEVHLLNPTSTVAMSVEEWFMFTDNEDSALSIVSTSEGGLWCDSADVDSSVPTVWVGPSKPFAYHPAAGLIAQGTHTFRPGPTMVTSVSDSNDYVEVDLTYHERWHSNAAR
jgi:hypothetical protein